MGKLCKTTITIYTRRKLNVTDKEWGYFMDAATDESPHVTDRDEVTLEDTDVDEDIRDFLADDEDSPDKVG